ncbi:hypothetical protein [Ligilactobacillus acidipiscis]|uniref:hypothetical protein n=1 Tax=Ligilactobacillus acidipiscis TaxID=89059 RepID=UPI0023F90BD3|nr:hypothetical protein [Ligilactobacillus acidipiscis]WEV56164.1 hypothetical protein OZX66_07865 [Ligilactobacillus acidipiscis]
MYRQEIEVQIKKLHDEKGVGTYHLESLNQNDVCDTMNRLHLENPSVFDESEIYYDGLADVSFNK